MSKLTKAEVAMIVDSEGLGYAVSHYLSPSLVARIEDTRLRLLWTEAAERLQEIESILEDYMP